MKVLVKSPMQYEPKFRTAMIFEEARYNSTDEWYEVKLSSGVWQPIPIHQVTVLKEDIQ